MQSTFLEDLLLEDDGRDTPDDWDEQVQQAKDESRKLQQQLLEQQAARNQAAEK